MNSRRDANIPLALVFRALADPVRLCIVDSLRRGEYPVGVLAGALGLSQATMSQHLAHLREAGLVSCRAEGARNLYSLNDQGGLDELIAAAVPHATGVGRQTGWRGQPAFRTRKGRPRRKGMPP